jgi:hypothetical protein
MTTSAVYENAKTWNFCAGKSVGIKRAFDLPSKGHVINLGTFGAFALSAARVE